LHSIEDLKKGVEFYKSQISFFYKEDILKGILFNSINEPKDILEDNVEELFESEKIVDEYLEKTIEKISMKQIFKQTERMRDTLEEFNIESKRLERYLEAGNNVSPNLVESVQRYFSLKKELFILKIWENEGLKDEENKIGVVNFIYRKRITLLEEDERRSSTYYKNEIKFHKGLHTQNEEYINDDILQDEEDFVN
jgi:hypothetical protein